MLDLFGSSIYLSIYVYHIYLSFRFSHDRGVCFKKEELDTTGYFSLTKGLLIDPKATSLYAFALGLEGNDDDDQWRLIAINFESILTSPCERYIH